MFHQETDPQGVAADLPRISVPVALSVTGLPASRELPDR